MLQRREFLSTGFAYITLGLAASSAPAEGEMYGLITKLTASPGKRKELVDLLLKAAVGLPGCLIYVVAEDVSDATFVWITEVWRDRATHDASLSIPSVRDAIAAGRPLIVGVDERVETTPVGGVGLP